MNIYDIFSIKLNLVVKLSKADVELGSGYVIVCRRTYSFIRI